MLDPSQLGFLQTVVQYIIVAVGSLAADMTLTPMREPRVHHQQSSCEQDVSLFAPLTADSYSTFKSIGSGDTTGPTFWCVYPFSPALILRQHHRPVKCYTGILRWAVLGFVVPLSCGWIINRPSPLTEWAFNCRRSCLTAAETQASI